MSGRGVTPTACAGLSHALAPSWQTGELASDIIAPPVVSYHSSAESFHPCSSADRRNSMSVCFQQGRWIRLKPTCSLCLKQTKVLLKKAFYQQSYSKGGVGANWQNLQMAELDLEQAVCP